MKKNVLVLWFTLFSFTVFGQEIASNKLWVSFCDTNIIVVDGVSNNSEINELFSQTGVTKIDPLFPFAKTPFLRHSYEVTTDMLETLHSLVSNRKDLFSAIAFVYEPQMLYDPADWMWYHTTSNNISDDWLWYLVKIQASDAWDITKGSQSLRIAVVDDGFDYYHPDLVSKIDPPYDFYSGIQEHTASNHGTSVSSILAAETVDQGENPQGIMASVGYNSKIMVSSHSYAACLYASTVLNADILSISWYGNCSSNQYFQAIEQEILNNGTIIVRAAGNGSVNCGGNRLYPFSGYEDGRVIVVSSTDFNDYHTSPIDGLETVSHYPEVDVCAPGYHLMGAKHSQNGTVSWPYFGGWGGTSQSTPIVSGVCALIKSVNNCLTSEDVQNIIKLTCDPILDSAMYLGLVGSGRINAYKAVSLAQSYHDSDILISSDVVWASNSYQGGSIIVDSLATLTINSTINFAPSARIIVRPGGKLIVDGGTLTSACAGEMWQGIEVVGNRTQHQTAAHQGTVILRNNATIENAHCAVKTGLEGNEWLTSGGIVQCTGSTFKNNRRAVEFYSYADTLASGNIGDNKSWFKNCTFTLDSTNLFLSQGMQFLNHVTLWDVKGVSFEGCTFENSTAGNTTDRKHGIYALGAGFKVNTLCNTLDGCNCYGAADTSLFAGFSTAVEVGNDGCPYSVTIDEAKFENNGTGVSIQACDYATVTRCAFDLSTSPIYPRGTIGLALGTSTGYKVEGNTFTASANATSLFRRGILVWKSGFTNNSIYRNTLENLDYGIFVSDTNGSQRSGLCFTCNTFHDCDYGIYVDEDAIVSPTQGARAKGAANVFTGSQASSFYSLSPWQTTYYFKALQGHHLYQPLGLVLDSIKVGANLCTQTICDQGGNVTPVTNFAGLDGTGNAVPGISSGEAPDGTGVSHTPYMDDDSNEALQAAIDNYYAAVRRIMADSVESLPDLLAWHAAAGALASPYALTEIFAAMENSTGVSHTPQLQADAFSVGASHTPPISQPELDNYAAFRALAASLRPSSNNPAVNWPAATPAQIDELQRIAEANTGRSSAMAKGVLCFFFDICYGEEIDGTLRAGTYSGKGGKTAQWTYWPEHTNVGIPCYSQPFSLLEDTLIGTLSYNKSDFAIRTASGQNANILILDDSTGMYYYDTIFQIPRMLYDYSAEEGGQFTVYPIMGDTNHQILVTVDSIGYETVDNQILKSFYIHTYSFSSQEPDYIWSFDVLNMEFKAKYIEHIGSTCFLLPQKVSPIHYSDVFYRSLCSFDCESVHYQPIDSIDCNEPYDFIIYDVPQHEQPLVQLHPNPAANSITISGGAAITRVAAYNAQGQLMTVVPVTHQVTCSMNVTNWPKGLYFIHVETESGTAALKMVKL